MGQCGIQSQNCKSGKLVAYEVCPKSSFTSLSKVLDKHIGLNAYAFHKVRHQLNKCSKFDENKYSCFGVTLS